jgi:hypothetical protein
MKTIHMIKAITTTTATTRFEGRRGVGTRQTVIRRGLFDKMSDESSSSSSSSTTSAMERERTQTERLREMARKETSMRGNRYVERESGAKRGERAVLGFWQTFANVASEARRKHWSTGRKTVDGSSKREGK